MNYIVIFNFGYSDSFTLTDSHNFIEEFSSYEEAFEEGQKNVEDEELRSFKVFAECTKEKNHLI